MNIRNVLVVGLVIATGLLVWFPRTGTARAQEEAQGSMESWNARFLKIEEKAKTAESNDPDSVRALADEVFGQPHRFGTLPDFVKGPVEDRVLQAELDYRNGSGRSLTHADVARTINWLSDTLGLPTYAKTSERQIFDMRVHSMQLTPRFMGKGFSKGAGGSELRVGDHVNPELSPLQACYLAMFAVDEKLGNPDYQVPPEDWEKDRDLRAPSYFRSGPYPRLVFKTSRKMQLIRSAESRLLPLAPDESVQFANSVLDNLGIAPIH